MGEASSGRQSMTKMNQWNIVSMARKSTVTYQTCHEDEGKLEYRQKHKHK